MLPGTSVSLPSDASKRIRDMELEDKFAEAEDASLSSDHDLLRREALWGKFYISPSYNILVHYAP
jgi:hypothetical protein